jgi:hypothetical protein
MKKSLFGLVALLLAAIVFTGCPTDADDGEQEDTRKELTAGPAVEVAASAATANVTFTGASGLSLSAADFTVSSGGIISEVSEVSVSSDTATVTVGFAANISSTSTNTYTVSIAPDSAKIKGSATVSITQDDTRVKLTAGPAVEVAASDTTGTAAFTGASGLTLSAADFAVSSGGTISEVSVSSDTVTVTVGLANTDAAPNTYIVSIALDSAKIRGSATVTITQKPEAASLYIGASTSPEAAAGTTLASALTWLQTHAASNTAYTIMLASGARLEATTLNVNNAAQVSITLRGKDAERTIQLADKGSLFTIDYAITLILDQNITLKGAANNTPLVKVSSGGTLEMREGAKITGNNTKGYGGGVYNSGIFNMEGGEISGNFVRNTITDYSDGYGGGVYNNGTFNMKGGKISGNGAYGSNGYGGGVYSDGTFNMKGGEISGNGARSIYTGYSNVTAYGYGGGVCNGGTFNMEGGEISGNTASGNHGYGGGVYSNSSYGNPFTMEGGEISGNTASGVNYGYGGGVCNGSGTFNMEGGEISGNTASGNHGYGYGGGVCNYSRFTMKGGEISGNTALSPSGYGGGVYNLDGIFTKTSGVIGGNTALNGGAVYSRVGYVIRRRDNTAGTDVNLNSGTLENWE